MLLKLILFLSLLSVYAFAFEDYIDRSPKKDTIPKKKDSRIEDTIPDTKEHPLIKHSISDRNIEGYRVVINTCTTPDSPPQTGEVHGTFYDGILGHLRLLGSDKLLTKNTDQNKITPDTCWKYMTSLPCKPKAIKGLKIQWKKTGDEDGDEIKIASVEICSTTQKNRHPFNEVEDCRSFLSKRFQYKEPIKDGKTITMNDCDKNC